MKKLGVLVAVVIGTTVGCGIDKPGPGPAAPAEVPEWSALSATLLVPRGSAWRYSDTGSDLGTAWLSPSYDDTSWKLGAAQLGYGDGDEATTISYGPNPNARYITTYFRRTFVVTDPTQFSQLTLQLLRDDGAVAYLNGVEIARSNMPAGTIAASTLASSNSPDENNFLTYSASVGLLHAGTNVLQVEVHQYSQWSSDVSFDAELSGTPSTTPPPPPSPTLVARGSTWRYWDQGGDQGTAWRSSGFNDASWKSGTAQFGYGDGDETTVIGYGPNPNARYITTYFRRSFVVSDPSQYGQLTLKLLRDDGAVAYLNGLEIARSNMPGGTITASTLALENSPDENTFLTYTADATSRPGLIVTGTNVLEIEVHQYSQWSSDVSFDAELSGTPSTTMPPPPPPPTGRIHVDSWMANYGPWDANSVALARRHKVVVAHPRYGQLTRALVASIQAGVNASDPSDDVKVICYVSVGEDARSAYVTDQQARQDPRFVGDGTGPRVDPRGPNADGKSLAGIDPRGAPSNGGTGYASFYLDDDTTDCQGHGDGIPDRNKNFGSYFVNAGDPNWFPVLDAMTLDGGEGIAGMREILTTTYGRGLGCDGLFLDTLDTAAPNQYTSCSSSNPSKFEWTAPGFSNFVRHLRQAYPGALIMQNRGLFFLDPRHPQYQYTTRGAIDFVLFESLRLDSSAAHLFDPYFYPDNRYNVGPKLLAEAGRADGFQILSLGYAEGPSGQMSHGTLLGQSTVGYADLIEDIRVTEQVMGLRHYLTDAKVALVNSFVLDHTDLSDTAPPVWTSSYNDHNPGYPTAPGDPSPRVGVREILAGSGQLTVRWDVALDKYPVGYAIYYQTTPFDFASDPKLLRANRVVAAPRAP
ncbi:MAG TPA: hypothetical protein VHU40_18515, partial [Polyangia bacterium]|nr:hypothetical protein [Polyangia bacterium]